MTVNIISPSATANGWQDFQFSWSQRGCYVLMDNEARRLATLAHQYGTINEFGSITCATYDLVAGIRVHRGHNMHRREMTPSASTRPAASHISGGGGRHL